MPDNSLQILVVDDELPAREEFKWLLEQSPGEYIITLADSTEAALAHLRSVSVDVVFCDIKMPGANGLRLAESIRAAHPTVDIVFVTAYDGYAVDAFSIDAVDYLLKPVRLERLQQTLLRLSKRRQSAKSMEVNEGWEVERSHHLPQTPTRTLHRISVDERGVFKVIPVSEVIYFESKLGAVVAHTKLCRYMTDFSLKFLEENLDPNIFFRNHRSYIVQISAIHSVVPTGAGTFNLRLDGSSDILPLARSRASELKNLMPWSTSSF